MSLLDKVPGDLRLYIGGLFTLRRREALQKAGITHVLSVLRFQPDAQLFGTFKHLVIEVDDVEDENLLERFPETNRFIQEGLDGGGVSILSRHGGPQLMFGRVFLFTATHFRSQRLTSSAMGKSRSATCVIAYLMQKHNISASAALDYLRQARSICEPNDGFMKQLELYGQMHTPENVEDTPAYQRWIYQREIELSRACGQAPEAEKIRFEDLHAPDKPADYELRCRKCRRPLAASQYLIAHGPETPADVQNLTDSTRHPSQKCAHYFLDPLSWMRAELEQGKLEGRLECPKCHTNVGKYAWQGMQCSCSEWVVPGISLSKGRIDEVRTGTSVAEIRRPPGSTIPVASTPSHTRQNL